ncbi:MAG: polysaccharide deacetylase family protein [Candidatus Eisenbacteria bacterium]
MAAERGRATRRSLVIALAALTLAPGVGPRAARAGIPAGAPIARLKTTDRAIALSFDDGPRDEATLDTLLAILAPRHAHATFFVVGGELVTRPDIGRRLLAAGDEMGNHTWTHPRLDSIPSDSMRVELARTDSLIHALGQRGRILVRPPYGMLDDRVSEELRRWHRLVALFDVDPHYDLPDGTPPDTTIEYTLRLLGPGSIVVFHPWYEDRDKAFAILPPILDRLIAMGYRLVTVSELFKIRHATPQLVEGHSQPR